MALDRGFCVLRPPAGLAAASRCDWRRISEEVRTASRLYEARGWLQAPLTYHSKPPPLYAPQVKDVGGSDLGFRDLSFESEYEPPYGEPGRRRWLGYEANRIAHAWVVRHADAGRPWLMCIHGYSMGTPLFDRRGFPIEWLHRELGLNLIFPVLPLHGPRRVGWLSGERFFSGDCLDLIHAEAQAVWDLRRILSWVREQGATRIGVYGISLGAYSAALLGAFESDLRCVIAGMPPTDLVALARLHLADGVRTGERAGVDWRKVAQLLQVVSPLAFTPRVAPVSRFIFGGLYDAIVPPRQMKSLWRHWAYPRAAWYPGSHLSFLWEPAVEDLLNEALRGTLLATGESVAAA